MSFQIKTCSGKDVRSHYILSDDSMKENLDETCETKAISILMSFKLKIIEYQGENLVIRLSNTYLLMTKSLDYFDPLKTLEALKDRLKKNNSKYLVISFTSDWVYLRDQEK